MSQSRKLTFALAAIATLAATTLVSGSADAMVARGRGGHPPVIHVNHPPVIHVNHPHFHEHIHVWRLHERGYVRPVGYVEPVVDGICNCLTKTYTPEGQVVFKDLCTKEMASAPVDGALAQASEVPAPNNFAGKTYQDYLAANPQPQAQQKN